RAPGAPGPAAHARGRRPGGPGRPGAGAARHRRAGRSRSGGRPRPVGAERPDVALGVAHGEVAGPVVLVGRWHDDLRAGGGGPLEAAVDIVDRHVDDRRAEVERAALGRAAEPEPAVAEPGLHVGDLAVGAAVDRALLDAERVGEEPQRGLRVPVVEDGVHGDVGAHDRHGTTGAPAPAWTFVISRGSGQSDRSRTSSSRSGMPWRPTTGIWGLTRRAASIAPGCRAARRNPWRW